MMENEERAEEFSRIIHLNEEEGIVDMNAVRDFVMLPFPEDHPELRFYNWQLSLHALPVDRSQWESTWKSREQQYFKLVKKLFRNCPNYLDTEIRGKDHIECYDVMKGIDSDVKRIPGMITEIAKTVTEEDHVKRSLRRMKRVIYVFSVANTRCPYTQGFHEVAAPLFIVALRGAQALGMSEDRAESISFTMLFNLIIRSKLDTIFGGIGNMSELDAKFSVITDTVTQSDSEFGEHMFQRLMLRPLMFAFSWVSMLFAQKLDMTRLLELWDHILIYDDRMVDLAMMISASCLLLKRSTLRQLSYEEVMTTLSEPFDIDIMAMLRMALGLLER